jgi:lipoprotein-anchoring transpeptidase ErfK/SrfK
MDPREATPSAPGSRRLFVALALLAVGGALVVAGFALTSGSGSNESATPRHFSPQPAAPSSARRERGPGYLTARVTAPVALRARPGGSALARIGTRTEFGSPRVLAVVRERGPWLEVLASERPNGKVGWIAARRARLTRVTYSLHADLSRRRLTVRRDGRPLWRVTIAVGRPGAETPTGRFAVTDSLSVRDPSSPYGCCVLATTGHQPDVPQGWTGGDRIAIHSTQDLKSVGQAVSLGCMRATSADVRRLMRRIPLGTPVFVRE